MQEQFAVSERRACAVVGQARATERYVPRASADEAALTARIVALATRFGRYGYRRITALLHREGWQVNHKRVARLWRQEGLRVPAKQPKRGRLWFADGSIVRLRAEHPNHVWAYDFVFDRTSDGRKLRMLTVVDEYTRECLAIEIRRLFPLPDGTGYLRVFPAKILDGGRYLVRSLASPLGNAPRSRTRTPVVSTPARRPISPGVVGRQVAPPSEADVSAIFATALLGVAFFVVGHTADIFDGAERGLGAVSQVHLAQDARDVTLDGAFGDHERVRDIAVREPLRDQL